MQERNTPHLTIRRLNSTFSRRTAVMAAFSHCYVSVLAYCMQRFHWHHIHTIYITTECITSHLWFVVCMKWRHVNSRCLDHSCNKKNPAVWHTTWLLSMHVKKPASLSVTYKFTKVIHTEQERWWSSREEWLEVSPVHMITFTSCG